MDLHQGLPPHRALVGAAVLSAAVRGPLGRYTRWLHTRWPAGTVERLPRVNADGSTNVRGLYIVGDLTGIPLLKFAADSGARAVHTILADRRFQAERARKAPRVRDLVIVGAGVSGMAAALAARRAGLDLAVYESKRRFQTIADFPRGKPIYAYPSEMRPLGELQVTAEVKEPLLEELLAQARPVEVLEGRVEWVRRRGELLRVQLAQGGAELQALRVILAIGRSGNFRRLGVPGEELDKVYNRLHDPADFRGQRVLVVGGGDSALETAIALGRCGAAVTLSHRGLVLARPKPQNLSDLGQLIHPGASPDRIELRLGTRVQEIRRDEVVLRRPDGSSDALANDVVFSMIGREAPLELLRRSGIQVSGDWGGRRSASLVAFLLFCLALYNWKSGGWLDQLTREAGAFPYNLRASASRIDPHSVTGILLTSAATPSFWYTLAYSLLVTVFGVRRILRRKTPYVRAQTLTLMAIQVLPLFLLPELILPWLDAHGWLPGSVADALFPRVGYGHGREFWRAYGLVLAWPLYVYNIFTPEPLWAWVVIGGVQTFGLIPLGIYFWGKGVYCGWICSCGALAETLGDTERHKMPHGPGWNRFNMAGQAVLALAALLLVARVVGWILPAGNWPARIFDPVLKTSYKWLVDVFLAGVVGYGVYFWLSGRFWCRFLCPLAALMHIYARFSRFRILADKKKCISCNLCTAVCHQGIDVMNFANKGLPMADPECVRCSACIGACPTGVLSFGQVDRAGKVLSVDSLQASLVQTAER